jgi:Tfp pilus assembly protein PilV
MYNKPSTQQQQRTATSTGSTTTASRKQNMQADSRTAEAEESKQQAAHTCTCGSGCVDHGVHQPSDQHRLAELIATRDDALLEQRHRLQQTTSQPCESAFKNVPQLAPTRGRGRKKQQS